jgi:hypothetical protein
VFEDCTFSNLETNSTYQTYAILSRWDPLKLKNCTFNFKPNSKVGAVMAGHNMTMEGNMSFNNFYTNQPMINLHNGYSYTPATPPAAWLNNCARSDAGSLVQYFTY